MTGRRNREILTGGKKYAQKAAKKHRVAEVVFDKESRTEYLTGFHKRKLQRQKKAQEYNKEQDRLGRIEERRQVREERKKDMENQLEQFNKTMVDITHLDDSDAEEKEDGWTGFDKKALADSYSESEQEQEQEEEEEQEEQETQEPLKGILHHKEVYTLDKSTELLPLSSAIIDDETTVTVESLDNPVLLRDQAANLEAIARANNVNIEKSEEVLDGSIKRAKNYAVVCGVAKPGPGDKKQKKKKFRYLTKGERRENTRKEKTKSFKKRD